MNEDEKREELLAIDNFVRSIAQQVFYKLTEDIVDKIPEKHRAIVRGRIIQAIFIGHFQPLIKWPMEQPSEQS